MKTDASTLKEAIAAAIPRIVSAREYGEASVISVPIMYPSGAFAAVHVSLSRDVCFVSDCALGMQESEMAGASVFFENAARESASWFGVGFDGASVFVAKAPLDRIDGAIVAVANASVSAVHRALSRAAEAKERHANSTVFDLVSDIFGSGNVVRKMDIKGRDAEWTAHNIVTYNGQRAIFEFVGDHANAIASKYLMFSDLVKIDHAPSLNSVVNSIETMIKKAQMLSDISNVIEISSGKDAFMKYAKAS